MQLSHKVNQLKRQMLLLCRANLLVLSLEINSTSKQTKMNVSKKARSYIITLFLYTCHSSSIKYICVYQFIVGFNRFFKNCRS